MSRFFQSLAKNRVGLLLITLAACLTATGQLFWKLADGAISLVLILGFVFYFLGAAVMIVAFRFGSLSVLHPMLSMGYIIAIVLGHFYLNEQLTVKADVGVLCIVVGAMCLGGGD